MVLCCMILKAWGGKYQLRPGSSWHRDWVLNVGAFRGHLYSLQMCATDNNVHSKAGMLHWHVSCSTARMALMVQQHPGAAWLRLA
jgi:hypothetical protein